ncbi:MAG: GIY-YIG nuclease family protein [Oscillospiraceae bacterium]|nr:GIY-YIG nuclease family protein [Oscillospiraceae bacterium]
MRTNYVYLLRCADGTLYCGWTTDLAARVKAHNSGRGAKYTRSRLPVELVYFETYEDRHDALSREWHLKRLSREEKFALIADKNGFHHVDKTGQGSCTPSG